MVLHTAAVGSTFEHSTVPAPHAPTPTHAPPSATLLKAKPSSVCVSQSLSTLSHSSAVACDPAPLGLVLHVARLVTPTAHTTVPWPQPPMPSHDCPIDRLLYLKLSSFVPLQSLSTLSQMSATAFGSESHTSASLFAV